MPKRPFFRDHLAMFEPLHTRVDHALAIASQLARGYDEELEAIERVRAYAHAWLRGEQVEIDVNDVLIAGVILFAATGPDCECEHLASRSVGPRPHRLRNVAHSGAA